MNSNLNIAIIGTGFGKVIGQNFKAVDPTVKLYFSGRTPEKLQKITSELEVEKTFTDWKEMLTSQKFDLIVIASISAAHKEMFTFASQLDTPILVEKPAALTSADVAEMIGLVSDKKLQVFVNHEGRFSPAILQMKELISAEKLGHILTVRSGIYTNWYSTEGFTGNWNQDASLGGGQVYSIGTHQLDFVNYLLDSPEITNGHVQKVIYNDSRFTTPPTGDSQFSATFTSDKGTSIQLYNDTYCFGYKDITIEIIGTKGIIMYSDLKGLRVSFSNNQPLEEVPVKDALSEIALGRSILSRSMKFMVQAVILAITKNTIDPRLCTLEDEMRTLATFEKFTA
jgi:predicted dehydrogenase